MILTTDYIIGQPLLHAPYPTCMHGIVLLQEPTTRHIDVVHFHPVHNTLFTQYSQQSKGVACSRSGSGWLVAVLPGPPQPWKGTLLPGFDMDLVIWY